MAGNSNLVAAIATMTFHEDKFFQSTLAKIEVNEAGSQISEITHIYRHKTQLYGVANSETDDGTAPSINLWQAMLNKNGQLD